MGQQGDVHHCSGIRYMKPHIPQTHTHTQMCKHGKKHMQTGGARACRQTHKSTSSSLIHAHTRTHTQTCMLEDGIIWSAIHEQYRAALQCRAALSLHEYNQPPASLPPSLPLSSSPTPSELPEITALRRRRQRRRMDCVILSFSESSFSNPPLGIQALNFLKCLLFDC